jgi:hypothetical protein
MEKKRKLAGGVHAHTRTHIHSLCSKETLVTIVFCAPCMKVGGYMNMSRNAMMSAIIREKSGSGILFRCGAGKMKETFCLYC